MWGQTIPCYTITCEQDTQRNQEQTLSNVTVWRLYKFYSHVLCKRQPGTTYSNVILLSFHSHLLSNAHNDILLQSGM